MNPWKRFTGLASWLMRIAMVFVIIASFFDTFMAFEVKNLHFFIALAFLVFGALLFIGGFLSKHSLTVVSALILFGLSVIQAYFTFEGITSTFAFWLLTGSVALYFVSNGNK